MNNLHFSPEAQNDLLEIQAYIEQQLLNPPVSTATVNKIIDSLRVLQTYAQVGTPLDSIVNIETDYRFIVSGNYVSFYREHGKDIYIDRILYTRRNFMRILFPDDTTEE